MAGKTAHGLSAAALATLLACGQNAGEIDLLESRQQDILGKLGELDEKLDKVVAAMPPARPTRPHPDLHKVHKLPVGTSPVQGPVSAKVTIVEFTDFQ